MTPSGLLDAVRTLGGEELIEELFAARRRQIGDRIRRRFVDHFPEGASLADRVGELSVEVIWPRLLSAEGKREEARRSLHDVIGKLETLRTGHHDDLTLIHYVAECYRTLASMTSGAERREALEKSAAAWHSWPATSFTKREEQKDLGAAGK